MLLAPPGWLVHTQLRGMLNHLRGVPSSTILIAANVTLFLLTASLLFWRNPAPGLASHHHFLPHTVPMSNEQPTILRRPALLLFGDSLTERSCDSDGGWGAALAHHFVRKVDVLNRGFGGYNTRWALFLLDGILSSLGSQDVALATLFFGANDAALPGRTGEKQHVPVPEYKENLRTMVERMRARNISRIVIITPPPVDEPARVRHQMMRAGSSEEKPPDRTVAHAKLYADAACELAQELGLPCVNLWQAMQATPGWQTLYFNDGLHFTPAGNQQVFKLVLEAVEAAYGELKLPNMSNHFPWWDQIDLSDHAAYFKQWYAGQES